MGGRTIKISALFAGFIAFASFFMLFGNIASALVLTSSGSLTVSASVVPTPPTEAAFIDQPTDGLHVTTTPIVVKGRCGPGLLVRISNNTQLAGSVTCEADGTYTANIILVLGKNVLGALNYDAYDQPGPTSPLVTVFVDQPAPNQPGNQTNNQIIANAVGSVDAGDNDVPYNSSAQRIFEGTIIEPLAKVLGLNTPVKAQVNDWIRVSIYLVFILAFIALLWFTVIALR